MRFWKIVIIVIIKISIYNRDYMQQLANIRMLISILIIIYLYRCFHFHIINFVHELYIVLISLWGFKNIITLLLPNFLFRKIHEIIL